MEINSEILNELGKLYVSNYNADKQMSGSTFILPKAKFSLLAIELKADEGKEITFMDCKVIEGDESVSEIQFIENNWNEPLEAEANEGEERAKLMQDVSNKIAEEVKAKIAQLRTGLVDALREKGITFADDEAFKQFAKSQIVHKVNKADGNVQEFYYQKELIYTYKAK